MLKPHSAEMSWAPMVFGGWLVLKTDPGQTSEV